METDNKSHQVRNVSRLSKLQKEIRAYLATTPQPEPYGEVWLISHLPSTGSIIVALGRERTPSNYAAVSKALRRLEERGLIVGHQATCHLQGKGLRYTANSDVLGGGRIGTAEAA
jgi:hypothetical protein